MVKPLPTPKVEWAKVDDFADWREKPAEPLLVELLGVARDQVLSLGDHDEIEHRETAGGIVEVVPPGWKRAQMGLVRDVWNVRKSRGDDVDAPMVPGHMPSFTPNYKRLVNPTKLLPGIG